MKFAIIGVGGFVAPKHLSAIKDTGNELVAAMDITDSVGILDSYFPETHFFTEFERFERHLEKLRREHLGIDYLVVCTPNYLHDAHIRCGLRVGADIICEKPVTIKPHNLEAISDLAKSLNRKVYTIMQMRLHPVTKEIQDDLICTPTYEVEVEYIAPRGNWYDYSWKGNEEKSGGLVYNLGIHFIDLMVYLFGKPLIGHKANFFSHSAEGMFFLEHANVKWKLSSDGIAKRIVKVDSTEYDFTTGFDGLHTKCYESILRGEDLFDIGTSYYPIKIANELMNDSRDSNN